VLLDNAAEQKHKMKKKKRKKREREIKRNNDEITRAHLHGVRTDTSTKIAKGADRAQLLCWVRSLEPLVFQALGSRRTEALVEGQHLGDEILGKRGDIIPDLIAEAELTRKDLVEQLVLCLCIEGKVATEKHVQDDTDRPDIAKIVVDALLKNLRSHVRRAAAASGHSAGHGEILGQTKVSNLNLKLVNAVKQKVLRLKITVSNAIRVKVSSSRKNLLNNLASIILSEGTTLNNLIVKFTTTDILENKRDGLLFIIHIVELNDVRMIEFTHDGDLTLKKNDLFVILLVLIDDLNCDLLAVLLASSIVHDTEATATDFFAHSVL